MQNQIREKNTYLYTESVFNLVCTIIQSNKFSASHLLNLKKCR